MIFSHRTLFFASLISLGVAFSVSAKALSAPVSVKKSIDELPAPVAAMISQGKGVKFQDKFEAPGGLTGYVLSAANGERRIYYVTPDRKYAILGIYFDAKLNNVTAEHQKTYMNVMEFVDTVKPNALKIQRTAFDMAELNPYAFVEGKGTDLYVVFDPDCDACARMYKDTRAYLDRIRIHWIPVALATEKSNVWLNVFLQARNKGLVMQAMFNNETPPLGVRSDISKDSQIAARRLLKSAGASTLPLSLFLDANLEQRQVSGPLTKTQLEGIGEIADTSENRQR